MEPNHHNLLIHFLYNGEMLWQIQGSHIYQLIPEQDDCVIIKGVEYWVINRTFILSTDPFTEVSIQLEKKVEG